MRTSSNTRRSSDLTRVRWTNRSRFQMWGFYVCSDWANRSWVQRWSTHWNVLALKYLIFLPNIKIIFKAIVIVWFFCIHSNRCCFIKNMIWHNPVVSICRPSNPIIGSTENTFFIQCVDGRDPHIHKVWSLVLYGPICEVNPTEQEFVIAGTVGYFVTSYLAENGRIVHIIGKLSINDIVQILGVPVQAWGRGFKKPADIFWVHRLGKWSHFQ